MSSLNLKSLTWQEHVAKKLMKRLSNVKSPKKAKGPPFKKPRLDKDPDVETSDHDGDSSGSTIILPPAGSSTPVNQASSDEACMYFIN